MKRRAAAILAILVSMAAVFSAKRPFTQEPSFRSATSELVVLPVVVTDRQGRFVPDLPRDRFGVYDNGRRMPVRLFTNEDTPVTIGLIIDNSGSMQSKLRDVRVGVLALAKSSNPSDELFALRFNDDVRDALPEHRFLFAQDLTALESMLASMVAAGRTALYDALAAGLRRLEEGARPRKILVLISDGGDNASQATKEQVLELARRSNAAIYAIGIYDEVDRDQDPRVLKLLAQATGGERFLPESVDRVRQACEQIAREIRSGYTIGYEPPDRDGAYHHVDVKIEPPDSRRLVVRTRPGYFAAGGKGK